MNIIKRLGHGTFGEVWECEIESKDKENPNKTTVALKRVKAPIDSDFIFGLRELSINLKLSKHQNIQALKQYIVNVGDDTIKWPEELDAGSRNDEIILLYDIAVCDLDALVDPIRNEIITEKRAQIMISQILLAVEYMHKSKYIHRDIKPSNILYYGNNQVKLCDLGLCKKYYKYDYHSPNANTDCFKPPEVLLSNRYDYGVDIWAVGCTFYYLLSGGEFIANFDDKRRDPKSQLIAIIKAMPYQVDLSCFNNHELIKNLEGNIKGCTLEDFVYSFAKKLNENTLDNFIIFMIGMIEMNPKQRATATQLLDSDYLCDQHNAITISRQLHDEFPEDMPIIELCLGGGGRKYIRNVVIDIFESCQEEGWYDDKVLFTSIDLYDRLISRDERFLDLSEKDCIVHFKSCLYICIKYYLSSTSHDLKYNTIPLGEYTSSDLNKHRQMEIFILETVENEVYNTTCFDELTKYYRPKINEVFALLLYILDGKHDGMTTRDFYKQWIEKDKDEYIKKER